VEGMGWLKIRVCRLENFQRILLFISTLEKDRQIYFRMLIFADIFPPPFSLHFLTHCVSHPGLEMEVVGRE
jgi:hypothetical protein